MKRMNRYIPIVTVVVGLLCAVLRQSLFAGADQGGLLPVNHPANTLLLLLPASLVTLLLFYLWKAPKTDYRIYLARPFDALGSLCGAYAFLLLVERADTPILTVTTLVAALSFFGLSFYRVQAKKPPLIFSATLCLSLMVHCFFQYRQWGQFTQLQEYLFPALAALFTALYSLEICFMELPERNYKKAFILNQLALLSTLACLTTTQWPFYACMSLWLISGLFTSPYAMRLPKNVRLCMDKLEKAGYSVYAVGGCVRDSLLGLVPHDYDLCTNATPEQMHTVFADFQLVTNGEKHGTVGVILDGKVYEITTFRTEGTYEDNRHPDHVEFVSDLKEDLARRDFTVNAMAYHPWHGYVDPYGGRKDLSEGILRAVGDPETRFQEDALRILRGVRFACRFKLTPETKTQRAMKTLSPLLDNLARERVMQEMTQILCLMDETTLHSYRSILLQVIPELKESIDFHQHNPHHKHDVFTHTGHVLAAVEKDPALRWAALLHDVGKPQTFTQDETGFGHFYGHAKVSAEMASTVLHRLKASNALREEVMFLIAHHMDELSDDKALLRTKLSKYGGDSLKKLVALQKADVLGCGTEKNTACFDNILEAITVLEAEEGRLQIRDLAIDGHALMALGFEAGPKLGQCQQYLLEAVLRGEIPNEPAPLTQKAKEFLEM